MTAFTLRSVACTIFAMLRCTKTSPGSRSRMVVSGHLESEHPIHRISGDWPLASFGNRSGLASAVFEAHSLFLETATRNLSAAQRSALHTDDTREGTCQDCWSNPDSGMCMAVQGMLLVEGRVEISYLGKPSLKRRSYW
jgi:hypothetical protein